MEGINDWMRFKRTITIAAIVVALCGCTCGVAGCSERAAAQDGQASRERFLVSEQANDAKWTHTVLITDTETGCQYLWVFRAVDTGGAGGLTLLVDSDGKPILDSRYTKEGD